MPILCEPKEGRYKVKTIKVSLNLKEPLPPTIRDPRSVVAFAKAIYQDLDADQEHFTVLFLNKANEVNGFKVVHVGGLDEALVDTKSVFRYALLFGASAIIIAHNHPSGRTVPSPEDISLTKKLVEAGKIVGIKIIDHIILGNDSYSSFQEQGLI